jgi:hypothetical protein
MTKGTWTIIAMVSLVAQVHSAAAAVITHCGESQGMSFIFDGGLMPADKAGWQPDRVVGDFELIAGDDYSNPDITYNGTLGRGSYRLDGGEVHLVQGSPGFLLVVVTLPAPTEVNHYLFKLDGRGKGMVVWGSTVAAGAAQTSTLMTASCDRGSR